MAVHSKYITSTAISNYVANEFPVGNIDGINTDFELDNIPQSNSLIVRLSGIVQVPGVNKDYNLSDSTITFEKAPKVGQEVVVTYFY